MTNVKVWGVVSKAGEALESSLQTQVYQLFDALKIVVEEMLKLKQIFEQRIVTLED